MRKEYNEIMEFLKEWDQPYISEDESNEEVLAWLDKYIK